MRRFKTLFRQKEFHVLLFCVSLFLFGWPVVSFSDIERLQTMFIYLFVFWGLIVLLLYLVSRSLHAVDEPADEAGKK